MWIIDKVVWTEMFLTLLELWTAFIPRYKVFNNLNLNLYATKEDHAWRN